MDIVIDNGNSRPYVLKLVSLNIHLLIFENQITCIKSLFLREFCIKSGLFINMESLILAQN